MGKYRPIKQKTIFITSFHGLVSRILEGGIVEYLLEDKNLRIVIFVPDFKKGYFEKLFAGKDRVIIEGVFNKVLPRQAFFYNRLSFMLLNTQTMHIIHNSFRGYNKWYKRVFVESISLGLGQWKLIRYLYRNINYYFSGKAVFDDYFEKYKPDLLFSTDSKNLLDTQFLIEAKKQNIRTVSMVRSWDYLTAKGVIRVKPDLMLVHNEIIKKEAEKYADIKEKDIVVVGMPHFDIYTNSERLSRKEFYKKLNIPEQNRIILLAPIGSKFGDTDSEIFDILGEAIENGSLPPDLSILIRFPPGDLSDLSSVRHKKALHIEYPGISFKGHHRKENEMNIDDMNHLADSLFYSELAIVGPSTMVIDAAVLDKPIIFMGLEGRRTKAYLDSYVHIYDFDHMQNVLKLGGTSMANTPKELIDLINYNLKHYDEKKKERAQIVEEQCGILDGNSSKRLVDILKNLI